MKAVATLFLALLSLPTHAADIASCSNPSGKGYYPETGIVSAKDSGWADEKISDGIVSFPVKWTVQK